MAGAPADLWVLDVQEVAVAVRVAAVVAVAEIIAKATALHRSALRI
jgi:hypothetical protein